MPSDALSPGARTRRPASLRATLLTGLVAIQLVVLAAVCASVYLRSAELTETSLVGELTLRARTLADGVEIDPDGLEFEVSPLLESEFESLDATAFAVVTDAAGRERIRTPALAPGSLAPAGPWSPGAVRGPTCTLGRGNVPCESLTYSFLVRTEHTEDDDGVAWTPPPEHERRFQVTVAMDRRPRAKALSDLAVFLGSAATITLLVTLGAGLVLARIVLRPIARMTEDAEALDAERPTERLQPSDTVFELRRLAERLNDAFDRLSGALEKERTFVGDASHELRTPVSILLSNTDLLLRRPRTTEEYREGLELQRRVTLRMKGLVDDLLLMARAGASDSRTRFVQVATEALARAVTEEFAAQAAERSVRLDLQVESGWTLTCDREGVERVLRNLVSNAVKFTPRGGDVRVTLRHAGATCSLQVDDSGPGVAVEERERIFQRFHRTDPGVGGTGIGLAIVRALVEAHGGTVAVGTSSLGGARFVVELPGAAPAAGPGSIAGTSTGVHVGGVPTDAV